MLSLSIAIVDGRTQSFQDAASVSESLQLAKRRAKAIEGNCLWYVGPDGDRNLLEDPQVLSHAAADLPPPDSEEFTDTGAFEPLSVASL
jgi:hypothetical protein